MRMINHEYVDVEPVVSISGLDKELVECLRGLRGLRLRKSLGQHLLVDRRSAEMFAEAVGGCSVVYEIGCGAGGLTLPLSRVADYVFCSEIDSNLVGLLRGCLKDAVNVDVVLADALFLALSGRRHVVVSNTPFYLSSKIISMLCRDASLEFAVLGVQREVGERLIAAPGSREYGRLSVMAQLCFSIQMLFTIPREAYKPRPKVETVVLRLTPRRVLGAEEIEAVELFTRKVFPYRRKKLSTGIALGFRLDREQAKGMLNEAGIDPDKRVEDVTPEEARVLSKLFKI